MLRAAKDSLRVNFVSPKENENFGDGDVQNPPVAGAGPLFLSNGYQRRMLRMV